MPDKVYKPTLYQTSQASRPNDERKIPRGTNKGLMQAYEFRELAHREAMALGAGKCKSLEDRVTRARAIKDLNSVWYAASERIRIIKGKPMPGSLRPIAKPKKVRTINTKPLEQLPLDSVRTELNNSVRTESGSSAPVPDSIGDKHA